jgi:hypothetical protein
VKWDGETPRQEDRQAELRQLNLELASYLSRSRKSPAVAPVESEDGLAGYHEREAAARDEWARLTRHRELAEKMLAAAGLEPMAALRAWTADALAMVDVLPDNWLPGQNEPEWARLQLLVRAIFGLVYSGKLEPTHRTHNARLAAEVREAKMAAERW